MKWTRLMTAVCLLMLGACAPAPEPPKPAPAGPTPADTAAINKLRDDFLAAFNANDAVKVADLFSEDAVMLPADRPAAEGRAAIQAYEQSIFSAFKAGITLGSQETQFEGNWAFDRGTYEMTLAPKAGGNEMKVSGKYLVLIKRQPDGSWKVFRDMDNSMPTAAAGKQ